MLCDALFVNDLGDHSATTAPIWPDDSSEIHSVRMRASVTILAAVHVPCWGSDIAASAVVLHSGRVIQSGRIGARLAARSLKEAA